jgi:hypothetical protein
MANEETADKNARKTSDRTPSARDSHHKNGRDNATRVAVSNKRVNKFHLAMGTSPRSAKTTAAAAKIEAANTHLPLAWLTIGPDFTLANQMRVLPIA